VTVVTISVGAETLPRVNPAVRRAYATNSTAFAGHTAVNADHVIVLLVLDQAKSQYRPIMVDHAACWRIDQVPNFMCGPAFAGKLPPLGEICTRRSGCARASERAACTDVARAPVVTLAVVLLAAGRRRSPVTALLTC
jgi:hypothetical protein